MARKKGQASRFLAGALLLLLIVGLAGLGATNFGGRVTSIGTVGDTEIDIDRYARALNEELRALQAQTGQNITLSQAQQFGIDRAVLQRLVAAAAMENETAKVGLSIGDAEVQRQLLSNPAFQGATGGFDRSNYEFTLERNGLTPAEYESVLRKEAAANILQSAVVSGVTLPSTYTDVILQYVGERRSFSWTVLDETTLQEPLPTPSDDELRTYFEANGDQFMLPPMKRLTYAWLSPEFIVDQIAIDDAKLKELYDERASEYNVPERRLVERLIFATLEDAQGALQAITAGDKTFEDLVAERGLALSDIDLGDVSVDDLDEGADEIFGLTEPGIVGPIDTELGPALFRVNAILAARSTAFEDVRDTLQADYAADAARRQVADRIPELDDLLAGGATLEELADETDMQLGKLDWIDGETDQDIAAYEGFAQTAREMTPEDFPEIRELADGSIFALRVDEVVPERPDTFENAREKVAAAWRKAELEKRLEAQAATLLEKLKGGASLSSLGLPVSVQTRVIRSTFIEGTPPGFMEAVFALEPGESTSVKGDAKVFLAQLAEIQPPDLEDPDIKAVKSAISDEIEQALGQDALTAFTRAVELEAGISLNQAAINAVHAQFP